MNNETWYRLVIASVEGTTFYAHPEHGGITANILLADTFIYADAHLGSCLKDAKRHYPQWDWHPYIFNYTVTPIKDESMIQRLIFEDIRRIALAKLTPEEKEVLGL